MKLLRIDDEIIAIYDSLPTEFNLILIKENTTISNIRYIHNQVQKLKQMKIIRIKYRRHGGSKVWIKNYPKIEDWFHEIVLRIQLSNKNTIVSN
jgi:hypothetical protein